MENKVSVHYTEQYLVDPPHPVTVNVIGCGGTGSQVLTSLARMHTALQALGHPGLFVRAIDPDRVTDANRGRQLFSKSDIDEYKSVVLAGRINRFFGTNWEGLPVKYAIGTDVSSANITISCVDSGAARKGIKDRLKTDIPISKPRPNSIYDIRRTYRDPFNVPYYWLDFGNMQDRGQCVIGTLQAIKQPDESKYNCVASLATIDKYHPEILIDKKGDDQGPSCSLAEALGKQDLYINTNLANMGMAILWKMFRELHIKYHGCYLNLENMSVNPIKVA
jgi:PRTRC genetic system ThiF family protein